MSESDTSAQLRSQTPTEGSAGREEAQVHGSQSCSQITDEMPKADQAKPTVKWVKSTAKEQEVAEARTAQQFKGELLIFIL